MCVCARTWRTCGVCAQWIPDGFERNGIHSLIHLFTWELRTEHPDLRPEDGVLGAWNSTCGRDHGGFDADKWPLTSRLEGGQWLGPDWQQEEQRLVRRGFGRPHSQDWGLMENEGQGPGAGHGDPCPWHEQPVHGGVLQGEQWAQRGSCQGGRQLWFLFRHTHLSMHRAPERE